MREFIYRWWEGDTGPYEIKGSAHSIKAVAMRLELPVRPFRAEFLNSDGTPANILDAVAEEKAAAKKHLWIRVGDAGDYHRCGDIYEALDDLNAMEVGEILSWVEHGAGIGFETVNFHGNDFVSCFWGDEEANPINVLSPNDRAYLLNADERAYIENNLEQVLN